MSPFLAIAYGIDIGKRFLDIARSDLSGTMRVPNTPVGHARLLEVVSAVPDALIVLEPTGRYHRLLVGTLTTAGRQPVVVNAYQTRHYAKGMRKRLKTDAADAQVLADYGARVHPTPRPLPAEGEEDLADLVARREDLVQTRAAERNRQQTAMHAWERESIARHIAFLTGEITTLDRMMKTTITTDPTLASRRALLLSAPGISHTNAAVLLGLMPELGTLTRKTAAALAGVAPYDRQSGSRDCGRHIAGGRPRVRRALYMMAVTAIRTDAVIAAQFARLRATKPCKVALIAIARKMLGVLNAMLRDGIAWQETTIYGDSVRSAVAANH